MKLIFVVFCVIFSFTSYSQNKKTAKIKNGKWNAKLELNNTHDLPFFIVVKKKHVYIVNGDEWIKLDEVFLKNDSLHARFPYFNSELIFKFNKHELS